MKSTLLHLHIQAENCQNRTIQGEIGGIETQEKLLSFGDQASEHGDSLVKWIVRSLRFSRCTGDKLNRIILGVEDCAFFFK